MRNNRRAADVETGNTARLDSVEYTLIKVEYAKL
jgi:hypothetical protein